MKWPLEDGYELQDHESQLRLCKHGCHSQGPTCPHITPACISETSYKSSVNLFKKKHNPSKQAFLCGVGAFSPCLCGFPPGAPVSPIIKKQVRSVAGCCSGRWPVGAHTGINRIFKKIQNQIKKNLISLVIAFTCYCVCWPSVLFLFKFHQTFSVLFWNGILLLLSDTFDFCPGVFPANGVVWLNSWLFSAALEPLNSRCPPCSSYHWPKVRYSVTGLFKLMLEV